MIKVQCQLPMSRMLGSTLESSSVFGIFSKTTKMEDIQLGVTENIEQLSLISHQEQLKEEITRKALEKYKKLDINKRR